MKRRSAGLLMGLFCSLASLLQAQDQVSSVQVKGVNTPGVFPLVQAKQAATIFIDAQDAEVVNIAAQALSEDIKAITGFKAEIRKGSTKDYTNYPVIIGTAGQSALIDELIKKNLVPGQELTGKRESFILAVVDQPYPNVAQALIIVGSDRRGTAYGVFELSRRMGVSPWYWWADVKPAQQANLFITPGVLVEGPPAVKYRGIFLNDEDWGLQPWAAQTQDKDIKDIGPNTYARIFELLLRLKANLIWPAMHPSTKAFFHYPGNQKIADTYAMVVGTSHAEPMLRNNVDEWNEKTMGAFDYFNNQKGVHDYWEKRVKEAKNVDAIYTLGMRGVHDSGMKGAKNAAEATAMLERIMEDQRQLLQKHVNKDVTQVPQAFTAYKEVLDLYERGMKVPEDITLVWPDDNYGYIHRLSNPAEQKRKGGSGVYYHASYWGRPHDYLWLGSTHPGLIKEEMLKAYDMQARDIWVLNVGDLKPLEHSITLFLDMAYRPEAFRTGTYAKTHLQDWLGDMFGKELAEPLQKVLWAYYTLAFERRPEFMGWSQTEPTTQTRRTAYNHFSYGDEAQKRIDRFEALEQQVKALKVQVKPEDFDAFYQLVYYPVMGASLLNKKFLYLDKSHYYARQNRLSAKEYAAKSKEAYETIVKETAYYNQQLAGGKWKGMMHMKPRDLPVFQEPVLPKFEKNTSETWRVLPEGYGTKDSVLWAGGEKKLTLPILTSGSNQAYFIDVFLSKELKVKWKATTSAKWIKLSDSSGELSPSAGKTQQRIWVTINPRKIKGKNPLAGTITFTGGGDEFQVNVPALNPIDLALPTANGFMENNGYVSMFAHNYTSTSEKSNAGWQKQDGLGHPGSALMALPLTVPPVTNTANLNETAPFVAYDFYTYNPTAPTVNVFTLPTHPVTTGYSMRYGISVDDGPVQVVDFKTVGRSEEWKQNVLSNTAVRKAKFAPLSRGKHTLKIYMIDPGVVLDRITIDLGGLQPSYGVVPETKWQKELK